MGDRARSVSNHLSWCAASSEGDGELVSKKWLSILNHITDVYEGHEKRFLKYWHSNQDDRDWIKKGTSNNMSNGLLKHCAFSLHIYKQVFILLLWRYIGQTTKIYIFSGSLAFKEIEKHVKGRLLVQDIKKLPLAEQTLALVAFRNVQCMYVCHSATVFLL